MQNNEILVFLFLKYGHSAKVNLGSGTYLNIPLNTGQAAIYSNKKPKGKNFPAAPEPVTITQVDGVEIKVERLPIRYEKLEDVLDELPEFVQDLLAGTIPSP